MKAEGYCSSPAKVVLDNRSMSTLQDDSEDGSTSSFPNNSGVSLLSCSSDSKGRTSCSPLSPLKHINTLINLPLICFNSKSLSIQFQEHLAENTFTFFITNFP